MTDPADMCAVLIHDDDGSAYMKLFADRGLAEKFVSLDPGHRELSLDI